MGTIIEVEAKIEACDVILAMLDDGVFAEEMWFEITDALDKGMMLDDLSEQIKSNVFREDTLRKLEASFKVISDLCRFKLETL